MRARFLPLIMGLMLASACKARQVEVRTAPTQQPQVSLQINNGLAQSVNVYIVAGGTETFVRQVAGNSTVTVPVQGFAPGSTVGLKAVSVDGTRTFSRASVVLTGTYQFVFP